MSLLLAAVLHGDLEEQIALLGRMIEASPEAARHRLRRGELLRSHGEQHPDPAGRDWGLAEADFARALELEPGLRAIHLARGRMRLAAGRPAAALAALEAFLADEPGHAAGLLYRARALDALGRGEEAVESLTESLGLSGAPDVYLERADLLDRLGRKEASLRGIEEGLARLGPVVTLDLRALELELALGRLEAALARVERRLEGPGRREEWQLRRAEILERLRRPAEARMSCEAGLLAIEALPPARREAPATQELTRRLRETLARLR